MSELIAGTCYFSADGKRYNLVGEFAWRNSGKIREIKEGSDGIHGHKEKPRGGMIRAKLRDSGAVPLNVINDMVDVTITVELSNGKTVIGRNMFRSGEPVEADGEEGEYSVTFEGPDVRDA